MLVNLQKSVHLANALPKTGSIADQILSKELKEKFSVFFEEMKEKTGLVIQENGLATFDKSKDEEREFSFSESEKHVLKLGVKQLDDQGLVTMEMVDLCKEILAL